MLKRTVYLCAAVSVVALLTCGCGNKEKAEMYLMLDANTRYPAM